jgi:hypothetical protein
VLIAAGALGRNPQAPDTPAAREAPVRPAVSRRQTIRFRFSSKRPDRLVFKRPERGLETNGAGDRDRTDDIQLGKLTFYH